MFEGGDEQDRPRPKPWPAEEEEEIHEGPREKHGKLLIEKIEASLSSGKPVVPWKSTWDPEMNPRNIRGNMYRGGNLMMTLFARRSIRMLLRRSAAMLSGYSSPFFLGAAGAASSETLPYNQALEHGGDVKPRESTWHVCNARDAHREVGTPEKPVRVTLPTELPRQLLRRSLTAQLLRRSLAAPIEFKDEGPGISPRRMGDIFLNFRLAALGAKAHGASTKRRDKAHGASTKRRCTGDLR